MAGSRRSSGRDPQGQASVGPVPPGQRFSGLEPLGADGATAVFRARDAATGQAVLLKVVDPQHGTAADLERLHHEYEIARSLHLPGVARPLAVQTHEGAPGLVFEDWGGEPLDRAFALPMPLGLVLDVAVGIAAALADLHRQGIVHKDIKPRNVLVHPATLEVKLVGLGLATRLPRERQRVRPSNLVEGSLPYMSPEQTGLTNGVLDSRSDLYSIGATLYQLLTGHLLCDTSDPLDWLHFHVARLPADPARLVDGVPDIVSRIIMRLLAKAAEDRYQTAWGLEHDLARCRNAYRGGSAIAPFALQEQDIPDRLQFPHKLYGREVESAVVLSALERVAESGLSELVVVSGLSGVGKSVLVGQLEAPTLALDGQFVSGKADPYQRGVPYSALVQAFDELMRRLLAENADRSGMWQRRIKKALGEAGKLITAAIPALESLVGEQPPVAGLAPAEAQLQFHSVFRRFVSALACEGHPLVLLLDDLQWADRDTLPLLQDLVTDPEVRYLLVLATFRDNEVQPRHPLALTLQAAQAAGARVTRIALEPLSGAALTSFVVDTLHCRPHEATLLAALIRDKTGGIPFFAAQFLTELHNDGLLYLDRDAGVWRWDEEELRRQGLAGDVTELMVSLLTRLPAPALDVLKKLACLGNEADLTTLSWVTGRAQEQVRADLWAAMTEGLVVAQGAGFRFAHDSFREAVYALVPEEIRAEAHLRIGRLLLARLPVEAVAERVFEVANQFARGLPLLDDPGEREMVRHWNVVAGRRAKRAVAYGAAAAYLGHAAELLPPDAWQNHYKPTFDLLLERCECEYLGGDFPAGEALCDEILARARSDLDRTVVHRLRIRMYELAGRNDEAMTVAADALRPFGLQVPEAPEDLVEMTEREERSIALFVSGRCVADLADAPAVTAADTRAVLGIIADSLSPAYMAQRAHFPLLAAMGVNVCLRHGHTEESSSIYNSYALGRAGVGDFDTAFEFSDLALRLLARLTSPVARGIVLFRHGFFVDPWRRHLSLSLPYLRQSESACREGGNLLYAGYARFAAIEAAIELGHSPDTIIEATQEAGEFATQAHNDAVRDTLLVQRQFAACLKGATCEPGSLEDESFRDTDPVAGFAVWRLLVLKQVASYLFGRYGQALEASEQASEALRGVVGLVLVATHHFYRALTLAALHPAADEAGRAGIREALDEELRLHEQWARYCPANFAGRHTLVAAEVARIDGREVDAERLYEEAIRSAREHGFVNVEAIGFECAAAFYRGRGLDLIADTYLREARARYLLWGAIGKVRQLQEAHPQLTTLEVPLSGTIGSTFAAGADQLDLLAIVRASQTISGEIKIDLLAMTLLKIVMQHSGAQRCCLLLEREGTLRAHAEAVLDEAGMTTRILPPRDLGSSSLLPVSVVRNAEVSRQPVVLDGMAHGDAERAADPYFGLHRPRSVLALPILRGADLLGLLYLENDLVAGAFAATKLAALQLLSAQAAISLETARLYASLQQLNVNLRELNSDLQQENAARERAQEEARQLNHQLAFRALHDDLTGLPNRALLLDHLQAALRRAHRSETRVGVLFIDLDDFKSVNDSFGHVAGDGFLVQVGRRISASLRGSDTAARVGGDEFVVVCEDVVDVADVAAVAQRLRAALAPDIPIGDCRIGAPASIGIALSTPGSSAEELLRDADSAMYRAKRQGGQRWELADTLGHTAANRMLGLETALRKAISCRQLLVHYQPTIDLESSKVVGVEALLRWEHQTWGMVPVQELIQVAERRNLIGAIGDWVLQAACGQAGEWVRRLADAAPVVAVNVSSRQLGGQGFPERVAELLERNDLPPSALCLEITETQLVSVDSSSAADLLALRGAGVGIAVDDFGMGFAGFEYLRRLPVTTVKIDKSYVQGLGINRADTAIVAGVITLARNLGLRTVAEGIETEQQRNLLRELRCPEGQGWLWHPALPAEQVEEMIHDQRVGAAPTLPEPDGT